MLQKMFPNINLSNLSDEEIKNLENIFFSKSTNKELLETVSDTLWQDSIENFQNYLWKQIKKWVNDSEDNDDEKENLDQFLEDNL